MMNQLYFAYGSNLDRGQMFRRCPGALEIGHAWLPGYRLAFAGHSSSWGGAVATAVSAHRSRVPGFLYSVTAADLAALDTFEGHPAVYTRRSVVVEQATGTRTRCWCYFLNAGDPGPPSAGYFEQILQAYQDRGMDPEPLFQAEGRVRKG